MKETKSKTDKAKLGGVKTKEGKNISRLNAIKHGFFSKLVTKHDIINHEDFADEMYDLISPQDIYQTQLLEILLSNFLSFRRVALIESKLIENELEVIINRDELPITLNIGPTSYKMKFKACFIDELIKFQRYKTSALNSILRTKKAINNLKNE